MSALLREARDPNTAAPRLLELAGRREPELLRALASHPGMPEAGLVRLLESNADRVLANPAFTMALLMNPQLLHGLRYRAIQALVVQREALGRVLGWGTGAPGELESSLDLAAVLKRRPWSLHPDRLRSWRAGEVNRSAKRLSAALQRTLAADPAFGVRRALAQRGTDASALTQLVEEEALHPALAGNEALPGELLDVLADSENHQVRCAAARNPSTPQAAVVRLARHRDPAINLALAARRKLPRTLRQSLRWSGHRGVYDTLRARKESA